MSVVKVYRVEREDGYGPYEDANTLPRKLHGWDDPHHPEPYGDRLYDLSGKHFAFPSLTALYLWFDGLFAYLAARGFVVAEYEASDDDVCEGRSGLQCTFMRKYSVLVRHVPWHKVEEEA